MSIVGSAPLPTILFVAFATLAVAGCGGIDVGLDDDTARRVEHDVVPVDHLRRLELTTDNGAIAIRLPDPDVGDSVDADSARGDVDIDVRTDPAAERSVTAPTG